MTSTLTSKDPPTADPALAESAEELASAMIAVVHQYNGIKSLVTTGPEGDHSPGQ